jgi:hypothetical protein
MDNKNRVLTILTVGLLLVVAAQVANAVDPTPPVALSAGDVQTTRNAPARASQVETYTQAVGTSAVHLFNTAVSSSAPDNQRGDFVQNLRIVNRDSAKTLCVWFPSTDATACATRCTATAATCAGTSGDGIPVLASSTYTFAITGLECACGIASSASATVTATRVSRMSSN